MRDPDADLECLNWKGRVTIPLDQVERASAAQAVPSDLVPRGTRQAYFGDGAIATSVFRGRDVPPDTRIAGPAIIEEPTTTLVIYPGMSARRSSAGNYLLDAVAP